MIQALGIEQVVVEPTRVYKDSSTLIDYVLTNNTNFEHKIFKTPKIIDHFIIGIRLTNYTNIGDTNKSINKTITTRSLCDEAYFQINIDLLTCDWNFDSTDTDVIFNDLNEKCTAVMNSKYPIKEIKCKTDNVPWYDIEIRELALERDRAYRYYINYSNGSNSMLLWNDYKIK
nr:unnamed protein product [Callosobruchus analis]